LKFVSKLGQAVGCVIKLHTWDSKDMFNALTHQLAGH